MFKDREHAARELAHLLLDEDVEADIVLAIPRGGLPLGRIVADALGAPLDIVSARKIGAPHNPELAIGAVASDGSMWINDAMVESLDLSQGYIDDQRDKERKVAQEKVDRYRGDKKPLDLSGLSVLIVDDGIATGATTMACVKQAKNGGASKVIVAVPVGAPDSVEEVMREADKVICVEAPPHFGAVGQFYSDFGQVTDEEAMEYLS